MPPSTNAHTNARGTLIDLMEGDDGLSVDDLARACHMHAAWVSERLASGLLQGRMQAGEWRCGATTIVRARRLAQFETMFDADPELAALTTDLIEEVSALRQRLRALQARLG